MRGRHILVNTHHFYKISSDRVNTRFLPWFLPTGEKLLSFSRHPSLRLGFSLRLRGRLISCLLIRPRNRHNDRPCPRPRDSRRNNGDCRDDGGGGGGGSEGGLESEQARAVALHPRM
jgi:hypothetical protein